MLSGEHVQTMMQTLVGALSPSLVYLFGSESKGTARPDSDIDIAYVSETKLDAYERFLLAQQLASLMNRDVDLIDLDEASTVMQMEIISQGTPIYCKDPSLRQARASRVYKMYARLNEERRDILQRILQGGC